MKTLPALKGSPKQTNWAYAIRAKRLEAWGAELSRGQVSNDDYERLISNTDAGFWISNKDRSLADVVERMQRNPATSDNGSRVKPPVKPHPSLSLAQLQLAKKLRGERLQAWRKDPLWRRRTERQRQWFVTLPLEWFLENIHLHCLFDVMLKFSEKMHELASTAPSQEGKDKTAQQEAGTEKSNGKRVTLTAGPLRNRITGEEEPECDNVPF